MPYPSIFYIYFIIHIYLTYFHLGESLRTIWEIALTITTIRVIYFIFHHCYLEQWGSRKELSYSKFSQMKRGKDVSHYSRSLSIYSIVANIAVVKPDKAERLENILL